MVSFAQLMKDLHAGKLAPVYLLFGEEPYFLDKAVALLEQQALSTADPAFNRDVVYGNEIDGGQLVGLCKQYPSFAERRLVLAKEAHRIPKKAYELLAKYVAQPVPSTVLALVWPKKQKPDGRQAFGKALQQHAVVFESKPVYDNQVPGWMNEHLQAHGFRIAPDAAQVVAMNLGTNLSLIEAELGKIRMHLDAQAADKTITRTHVHAFISIDRDFNVFELLDKLGRRDARQALFILHRLAENPKEHPPILLISQLYNYYLRLGRCLQAGAVSEQAIAQELGLKPFIARQYLPAVRAHSLGLIQRNLELVYDADLQLKGIRPTRMDSAHILESLGVQLVR